MSIGGRREPFILFLGDIVVFFASLWLTLFFRYAEVPSEDLFYTHLDPFLIIFAVWFLVFFIFGFYEKHTLILQSKLSGLISRVLAINGAIAVLFFYLFPMFIITPKVNLFIDLVITFVLLIVWRLVIFPQLDFGKKQKALLVGSGNEIKELRDEVNNNQRYKLTFVSTINLDEIDGIDFKDEILDTIYSEQISTIVIDLRDEKVRSVLPHFYNLIYSKVRFIDMHKVYEDIFDRVPLSLVNYNWFLENISSSDKYMYDSVKRMMDLVLSGVIGALSLVLYPFIIAAIKFEDGGPIFFSQERVGKNNKPIQIIKFRTMGGEADDDDVRKSKRVVTKVGSFLRKTRVDELPQLWSVFVGNISLIGPRPEIPDLANQYVQEIPYYNIRHLITPGLSGWAQIYHDNHPHHGTNVEATREKLSYDLYYIKNRSFLLDIKIALKTLKIILTGAGV